MAPRVAWLGDSTVFRHTLYAIGTVNGVTGYSLTTPLPWLFMYANQPFVYDMLTSNYGSAGQPTSMMLTRMSALIASRPDICFVENIGDALSAVPTNTTTANLQIIYQMLLDSHITPVAVMSPPCNTSGSSLTVAQTRALIVAKNDWTRTYAQQHRIPIWDWYTLVAAGDGSLDTSYTTDGTHMDQRGAQICGLSGLTELASIIPASAATLVSSQTDAYNARTNPGGNLLAVGSGLMLGTGGTKNNSVSGTVPTSWSAFESSSASPRTITSSLATPADGVGQEVQLAVSISGATGGTNAAQARFQQDITAGFTAGDRIQGWVEVNCLVSSAFRQVGFTIADFDGANIQQYYQAFAADPVLVPGVANAWSGTLWIPPFTVSPYAGSGTRALQVKLEFEWADASGSFSGTAGFSRATVVHVQDPRASGSSILKLPVNHRMH